jgi:hypothetical protein
MSIRGMLFPGPALSPLDPALGSALTITPPIQYYDLVTFDKFKPNVALALCEIIGLKFENHNFHRRNVYSRNGVSRASLKPIGPRAGVIYSRLFLQ